MPRGLLSFLLLLTIVALAGCQSNASTENVKVKDADFGTWAEFVPHWNGEMPGITGIGDPQQPETEERFARPV